MARVGYRCGSAAGAAQAHLGPRVRARARPTSISQTRAKFLSHAEQVGALLGITDGETV